MLLILKHWRLIAACAAIGGAFLAGWYAQGWRKEAALKAAHEAQSAALAEAIRQGREERSLEVERERIRALNLSRELAAERAARAALREEIANANLADTRTDADVDEEGNYSCPTPLADPDFIRLWNEAARPNHRRTGTDPG